LLKCTAFLFFMLLCIRSYPQNSEYKKIQNDLIVAKNDTARAKLLNDAAFLIRNNDPKLSLQYADLAMELSVKAGFVKGALNSYLVRGIIYKHIGDYEKSMQDYVYALQLSEMIFDTMKISSCYNNIGSIYQAQNNYLKAIHYFKKSLQIESVLGKKDQASIRLYNIGTVYESMNKLDSAYDFYNRSLIIEESLKNDEGISFALYGLGGVLTKKGEFSKAEVYLKKAFDLAKKDNDVSGMSYCLNELGLLYLKWKKQEMAISHFQKSLIYADSIEEKNQVKETYHNLAIVYAELGRYKEGYDYFSRYNELNEKINNSDISRKIAEINTKYEVDKIEREISLMKKEARIKELEFNQQKNLRNYLLFTSIIVIILGIIRYSTRKRSTKRPGVVLADEIKRRNIFDLENLLLSKTAWSVLFSIYTIVYSIIIQPFGLAILGWTEKWLVIAVNGAICFAVINLSYILLRPWNDFFRKHASMLKNLLLSFEIVVILSVAYFIYLGIQGLNDFSLAFYTEVLLHVFIIALLPVLLLVIFSERITYAENLKDLPLEVAAQHQQQDLQVQPEVQEVDLGEKQITIITDNVSETIKLFEKQIICFEANDNYTAVYYLLNDKLKKELFRITLKKIEEQLFDYKKIIRCHKSFIINITHLERISGNAQGFRMHLKNLEFEVPVSRSFPRQVIDSLKELTRQ
jgi:tetratricopeptide (TPR) repeat protein